MARSYAPLVLSIWHDDDFVKITSEAQRLYFLLISQGNIDYCGVVPFMPGRWSKLSKDSTPAKIRRAVAELEAARFVILDTDTEELWVRSFVKHNGVLSQPNVAKAMRAAYQHISSIRIRQHFYSSLTPVEQAKLPSPFPPNDPQGNGKAQALAEGFREGLGEPLAPTRGLGSGTKDFDLDLEPEPEPEPSSSTPAQTEEEDWASIEARRRLTIRRGPDVVNPEAWLERTAEHLRAANPAGPPKPRLLDVVPCPNPDCIGGHVLDDDLAARPCPDCHPKEAAG